MSDEDINYADGRLKSAEAARLIKLAKVLCTMGLQLQEILVTLDVADSPYAASARVALANVLEILSGVLSDLSFYADEDQPFLDLGEEPLTVGEAENLVRSVLQTCLTHLDEARDGRLVGICSLEARVTTLFCLLKEVCDP